MNADKWLEHFNKNVTAAYSGKTIRIMVGDTELECVVASTHDDRVRGLSEYTELPNDGMLFIYDGDHTASFQRKSMAFDVSIFFFDATGQLVGYGWEGSEANPEVPYRYVLETEAGQKFSGSLKLSQLMGS